MVYTMTPFQHDISNMMDYGVDTRGTDTVSKTPTQVSRGTYSTARTCDDVTWAVSCSAVSLLPVVRVAHTISEPSAL